MVFLSAFDANPSLEVNGVFLDLSKPFDRVWHEGFLEKQENSEINGNLDLIAFHNRRQRVVWNGQSSKWKFVKLEFHKALY